jgi:hypothetical protein
MHKQNAQTKVKNTQQNSVEVTERFPHHLITTHIHTYLSEHTQWLFLHPSLPTLRGPLMSESRPVDPPDTVPNNLSHSLTLTHSLSPPPPLYFTHALSLSLSLSLAISLRPWTKRQTPTSGHSSCQIDLRLSLTCPAFKTPFKTPIGRCLPPTHTHTLTQCHTHTHSHTHTHTHHARRCIEARPYWSKSRHRQAVALMGNNFPEVLVNVTVYGKYDKIY